MQHAVTVRVTAAAAYTNQDCLSCLVLAAHCVPHIQAESMHDVQPSSQALEAFLPEKPSGHVVQTSLHTHHHSFCYY
jgi:hypothetical protein